MSLISSNRLHSPKCRRHDEKRTTIMDLCIFTANHSTWLKAATEQDEKSIWLRSNKPWVFAKDHLDKHDSLPILFRETGGGVETPSCTFAADVVEIKFADDISGDRASWLRENLKPQLGQIMKDWANGRRRAKYSSPEEQFEAEEVQLFLKAATYYHVKNVREIEPIPMNELNKKNGGQPLALNFGRGYAICEYPMSEVQEKGK